MSFRRAALYGALFAVAVSPVLAQSSRTQRPPTTEPVAQSATAATDWSGFIPPTDGSFTTWGETPPDLGLVKRIFALAFPEECSWALGASETGEIADPDVYDILYRDRYGLENDPEQTARVYRFFCNAGAYNEQHVYMLWTASVGLKPVLFPEPSFTPTYEDDNSERPLKSIVVGGMIARATLTNSWYEGETSVIYTRSCWRGLCDASSQAVYTFDSGEFVLRTYDADPTYDGEVNPFRIYDATSAQPIALVPVDEDSMPVNPSWEQDE